MNQEKIALSQDYGSKTTFRNILEWIVIYLFLVFVWLIIFSVFMWAADRFTGESISLAFLFMGSSVMAIDWLILVIIDQFFKHTKDKYSEGIVPDGSGARILMAKLTRSKGGSDKESY